MAIIDDIYAAIDDYGLISSAEAKGLGLSKTELVQQARRGKLERVARGVYRVPVWPFQEAAPFAIAVKAAGSGAFLVGESVVALLGLAPTDPSRIYIAAPGRIRRDLGDGVVIARIPSAENPTCYEGVPCQPAFDAIPYAVKTMGAERALQATDEALRQGYVTERQADGIRRSIPCR